MSSTPPTAPTLVEVARGREEWQPWLALLDRVRDAAGGGAWRAVVPGTPAAAPPLLTGTTLAVDARLLSSWLGTLLTTAAAAGGPGSLRTAARADAETLGALLEAGLAEDGPRVAAVAGSLGVDASALTVVAGVAAMPLLRACAERWAARIPVDWGRGYCPICGAWAGLAEARGLERTRRLRCLRCAADWATSWLRCPYCGTDDHQRLGSLVPAADAGTADHAAAARVQPSVDTCHVCRGYLKTVTTLTATAPDDLGVLDLATVELDAAAVAQDYARPQGPGAPVAARVLVRRRGWLGRRWRG